METPMTMFKKLCKEMETKFIEAKLNSGEKVVEWQKRLITWICGILDICKFILLNLANIMTKLDIMT